MSLFEVPQANRGSPWPSVMSIDRANESVEIVSWTTAWWSESSHHRLSADFWSSTWNYLLVFKYGFNFSEFYISLFSIFFFKQTQDAKISHRSSKKQPQTDAIEPLEPSRIWRFSSCISSLSFHKIAVESTLPLTKKSGSFPTFSSFKHFLQKTINWMDFRKILICSHLQPDASIAWRRWRPWCAIWGWPIRQCRQRSGNPKK